MTETTPLDAAHERMQAAPGDDAARLRFYERLADTEFFLLLEAEPEGEDIAPQVFPVDGQNYVLIFDRQDRLTRFTGGPAAYAALSGRNLVAMLAPEALGLGVNLDVAQSSIMIPPEAVTWLADTLSHRPAEAAAKPELIEAPRGLPQSLLEGLDTKLGLAAGLAKLVYLAAVTYAGGRRGHLLAFVDAVPGSEDALAGAAGEALIFSGIDEGEIDVAFFAASDPVCARLARVGLRFDLPVPPEAALGGTIRPPGSDPDRPPRLR